MSWLDEIRFDDKGLVPAITQDATSGKILMMAWMSRESLRLTAEKKEAVYWSRSREKLWHKGEESGHTQKVLDIRFDCDEDVDGTDSALFKADFGRGPGNNPCQPCTAECSY